MRKSLHIIIAVAVAFCLFACGRGGRVIPPKVMANLYVRMILTDQWIRDNYSLSKVADTTLVYDPILEEAGYNIIKGKVPVRYFQKKYYGCEMKME